MQLFVFLMSYHRTFYTQAKSSGLLTSAYRMYNTCILFVCVCHSAEKGSWAKASWLQFCKNSTQYGTCSPVFLTQGLTTWSYQQDHCATSAVVSWCSSVAAVPPHRKSPVSGSALQRIVGLCREYCVSTCKGNGRVEEKERVWKNLV